jgi:hypothetical protein
MRRILTKKQQKRKERFNQIIVGIVLIFLMMLSIIGYSLIGRNSDEEQGEKVIYNGIEFINKNGFWVVALEDTQLIFKYNPQEVEKIDSLVNNLNSYYNQPLYIYSENTEASNEIYKNMNPFVERMQNACLEEGCGEDLPVKNCSNNFIIIREKNITGINQNQSCVFIEGPKENLVRLTDEFLFKVFGIE